MTLRCKPGDLAEVISTGRTPELKGRYVIVVRAAKAGDIYSNTALFSPRDERPAWVCVSPGTKLPWRVNNGNLYWVAERPIADEMLRPINPGTLPEEVETEEGVSA